MLDSMLEADISHLPAYLYHLIYDGIPTAAMSARDAAEQVMFCAEGGDSAGEGAGAGRKDALLQVRLVNAHGDYAFARAPRQRLATPEERAGGANTLIAFRASRSLPRRRYITSSRLRHVDRAGRPRRCRAPRIRPCAPIDGFRSMSGQR